MKSIKRMAFLLVAIAGAALAAFALAQQVTGKLGSPGATTTISNKQLPAPDPKFGGVDQCIDRFAPGRSLAHCGSWARTPNSSLSGAPGLQAGPKSRWRPAARSARRRRRDRRWLR